MTLSLVTKSSSTSLFLNTHLMSITVLTFVPGISFHNICLSIWLSSSCFAITQSRSIRDCLTFLGSSSDRNPKIKSFIYCSHSHSSVRISKNQVPRMLFTPYSLLGQIHPWILLWFCIIVLSVTIRSFFCSPWTVAFLP